MRPFFGKSIHRKFIAVMLLTLLVVNLPMLGVYIVMMHGSLNEEFQARKPCHSEHQCGVPCQAFVGF